MTEPDSTRQSYRGRIAPTPTGLLHLGHAATFLEAQARARQFGGTLIFRNEDLDSDRCKLEYTNAAIEDLQWVGIEWEEGPDLGGPHEPYVQSERISSFRTVWEQLVAAGIVYPCGCSRKTIRKNVQADPELYDELLYPGTCRPEGFHPWEKGEAEKIPIQPRGNDEGVNWRFWVPEGEVVTYCDERRGEILFEAGKDFGDFLIWRKDGIPSYELAVVVDDIAMGITEVVRGEDLLLSTARQLLLYRALGVTPPKFYHCPLLYGEDGRRLAKRNKAMGLRELRARGVVREEIPGLIQGKKK